MKAVGVVSHSGHTRAPRQLICDEACTGKCDAEPEHGCVDQRAGLAEVLPCMAIGIAPAEMVEPGPPVAAVAVRCRIMQQRQSEQSIDTRDRSALSEEIARQSRADEQPGR